MKYGSKVLLVLAAIAMFQFQALAGNGEYQIQGGDHLFVEVMDHVELSKAVIVRPDGMISFPLSGDVYARGFTVSHLQEVLAEKLSPFVKGVNITIYVENFFYSSVLVLGAVKNPGPITIFGPIDVIQLLGMTQSLDRETKRVRILRKGGEVQNISLISVWKEGGVIEHREDLLLNPGDTLIVYENSKITWQMIAHGLVLLTFLMTTYRFLGFAPPLGD